MIFGVAVLIAAVGYASYQAWNYFARLARGREMMKRLREAQ
jgi:hypothetical protein